MFAFLMQEGGAAEQSPEAENPMASPVPPSKTDRWEQALPDADPMPSQTPGSCGWLEAEVDAQDRASVLYDNLQEPVTSSEQISDLGTVSAAAIVSPGGPTGPNKLVPWASPVSAAELTLPPSSLPDIPLQNTCSYEGQITGQLQSIASPPFVSGVTSIKDGSLQQLPVNSPPLLGEPSKPSHEGQAEGLVDSSEIHTSLALQSAALEPLAVLPASTAEEVGTSFSTSASSLAMQFLESLAATPNLALSARNLARGMAEQGSPLGGNVEEMEEVCETTSQLAEKLEEVEQLWQSAAQDAGEGCDTAVCESSVTTVSKTI